MELAKGNRHKAHVAGVGGGCSLPQWRLHCWLPVEMKCQAENSPVGTPQDVSHFSGNKPHLVLTERKQTVCFWLHLGVQPITSATIWT